MKKAPTLVVSLVILALVISSGSVLADDLDGFRGIKWGADFSTVKNEMVQIKTDTLLPKLTKMYERRGDTLELGNVRLDHIIYVFWNNKFLSAFITYNDSFHTLKSILSERLGEPIKSVDKGESLRAFWVNSLSLVLLLYNDEDNGTLAIKSTKIMKESEKCGASNGL
jgi:hypothetical protein